MTTKKTAEPSPVLPEPITAANVEQKLTSLWNWISDHAVEIAIAVGVGTAIYLALAYLQRHARIYAEKQPDRLSLAAIIGRTLSKTKQYFLIMVARGWWWASPKRPTASSGW